MPLQLRRNLQVEYNELKFIRFERMKKILLPSDMWPLDFHVYSFIFWNIRMRLVSVGDEIDLIEMKETDLPMISSIINSFDF